MSSSCVSHALRAICEILRGSIGSIVDLSMKRLARYMPQECLSISEITKVYMWLIASIPDCKLDARKQIYGRDCLKKFILRFGMSDCVGQS